MTISHLSMGVEIALLAFGSMAGCSGSDAVRQTRTLQTGVDRAALTADISPYLVDWLLLLTSSTPSQSVEVGRPYGLFSLEKGPRLVFQEYWSVPIAVGTNYQAMAGIRREGDTYVIIDIGSAELAGVLGEREKIPAVSSALDQGRAGILHTVDSGPVELLAYEVDGVAYPANIRAQPLAFGGSLFAGLDGGMESIPDASLAEINEALPDR